MTEQKTPTFRTVDEATGRVVKFEKPKAQAFPNGSSRRRLRRLSPTSRRIG